ncbi:albusnodin family lasso peptide [Streptomyces roseifaciens]
MAEQHSTTSEQARQDVSTAPAVIELGDAATLTKGNTSSSVEAKQTPYS